MVAENLWHPYQGAVSLTFDDGTDNQLERAWPALQEFGIHATFYVVPSGDDWDQRCIQWHDVAKAGHEIGNHSLSHWCSSNFITVPGGLEDKSLPEVEKDIMTAQERLLQIAPQQKQWTFAYPCYNTFVGRGRRQESYVPVIAKHFLAGRGRGEYGFANDPTAIDLACVWGTPVERMSGFEMIGLVEELTHRGQWVILVFHEIDGQRLTVGSYDFKMLLRYLARKSESILTAPVVEVANRISEYQRELKRSR